MNRASAQALLTLLLFNQKAARHVALTTARRAVADGLDEVETDLQALARSFDDRLSAIASPSHLIDDGPPVGDKTWSSARIRLELDAMRSEILATVAAGDGPIAPAGFQILLGRDGRTLTGADGAPLYGKAA